VSFELARTALGCPTPSVTRFDPDEFEEAASLVD
jgi:hypothetical protein